MQCINKLGNSGKAIFGEREERLVADFCNQVRTWQGLCPPVSPVAANFFAQASAPYLTVPWIMSP